MKVLLAYDGTLHAKKALRYGIEKIKETGGEMTVLQVFDRNQYAEYGPRAEEPARAEANQQRDEASSIIASSGIQERVRIVVEEGDALETIFVSIDSERPSLVLLPPRYQSLLPRLTCPVMVIPGTVLVPVDRTGSTSETIDNIVREATATGSRVMLLGIIPVHLYSREEKKELERVKKETSTAVRQLKHALEEKNIEVRELFRSGYPDEEIMKAAGEFAVSLILMPSGSTTPSELSKAAAILLDESDRLKWPVFLLPPNPV